MLFLVAAYATWLILMTSGRQVAERVQSVECPDNAATEQDAPPNLAARAAGERERVLEPQA